MPVDPRISEMLEAFAATVRADFDAKLAALSATLLSHTAEQDAAAQAHAEARLAGERTAHGERLELEGRLADAHIEHQAALAALRAEMRDERLETFGRLLQAVRKLDDAASLSSILEALAHAVAAETSRVAVLIVEPNVYRSWGHFGFNEGQGPFDIPATQSAFLKTAAFGRQSVLLSSVDASNADLPVFMRPPAGQSGLITPLAVGGEVVAILYAEGADRLTQESEAAVWIEEIEVLARHASARLETVTSERTVAALTRAV